MGWLVGICYDNSAFPGWPCREISQSSAWWPTTPVMPGPLGREQPESEEGPAPPSLAIA